MSLLAALLLSAPIELQNRVARLPEVVAELAAESGEPLAVARELANELVFIRAQPREAEAWRRLLAEATCAEWESDGKSLRLTRSPGLKRKLEAGEVVDRTALYLAGVRKSLGHPRLEPLSEAKARELLANAKATKAATKSGNDSAIPRMFAALEDLLPAQRFLRRVLSSDVLAQFATVPVGEIGYWSTARHPVRKPLRIDAAALSEFNRDRQLLTASIQSNLNGRDFRSEVGAISDYLYLPEKSSPAVAADFRLERYTSDFVSVNVTFLDANGGIVERFGRALLPSPPPPVWPRLSAARTGGLTPPAKAVADSLALKSENDPIRDRAGDPVQNDPGEVYLRPFLDLLCERTKVNAVIGLSDRAIPAALNTVAKFDVQDFARDLEAETSLRTDESLLVGHPRYPIEATRVRLDRAVFRDLLRGLALRQDSRLDTIAGYAARQNPDAVNSQLERFVLSATHSAGYGNQLLSILLENVFGGRDTLRFYAQLTPAAQRALWSGAPVPLSQIPLPARQTLLYRLYRRNVVFETPPKGTSASLYDAPSFLANGIAPDAFVQAQTDFTPSVILADGKHRGETMELPALSWTYFRQTSGNDPDADYPDLNRARCFPAERGRLNLRFRLTPQAETTVSLFDFRPVTNAAVTIAALPPDYRKSFERFVDMYRQTAPRTGGSSGAPPPG